MKLDKVPIDHVRMTVYGQTDPHWQDNSGTIERDEFLSLPQVSSNPLATRYVILSTDIVITVILRPMDTARLTLTASMQYDCDL